MSAESVRLTNAECDLLDGFVDRIAARERHRLAVEQILAARLAAPFCCDTHLCGQCGGCKAAGVRDALTDLQARLVVAEASVAQRGWRHSDRHCPRRPIFGRINGRTYQCQCGRRWTWHYERGVISTLARWELERDYPPVLPGKAANDE